MKYRFAISAIAAIGVAAIGFSVLADPDGRHGGRGFQRVDLNGDGAVVPAEAEALRTVRFLSLDGDGDGVITEDEMIAAMQARIARRVAKRFARLDENGDGRIERAEFDAHGDARFARLDTDGDGRVSLEEAHARPHRWWRGWRDDKLPDE